MSLKSFYQSLPKSVRSGIPLEAEATFPRPADDWLIQGIYTQSVEEVAEAILAHPEIFDDQGISKAQTIASVSAGMAQKSQRFEMSVLARLRDVGIEAQSCDERGRQFVSASLAIKPEAVLRAVECLQDSGYIPWHPWDVTDPAQSFHNNSRVTLTSTDPLNGRVILQWGRAKSAEKTLLQRIRKRWHKRELDTKSDSVGPFLATPLSVVPGLLSLAQASKEDVIADLGCGQADLLIEVIQRTGAEGIGVENDSRLVQLATDKIQRAGLSDRISVKGGDLRLVSMDNISLVILFLPISALRQLLPSLRQSLPAGARIVAHEQRAPNKLDPPVRSELIVAHDAFTVAHRWDV